MAKMTILVDGKRRAVLDIPEGASSKQLYDLAKMNLAVSKAIGLRAVSKMISSPDNKVLNLVTVPLSAVDDLHNDLFRGL